MRRFSLIGLMGVVLAFGVALAALRNANDAWAGLLLVIDLLAVGVAVLGVVYARGEERAWWLGFGLFGGGYLMVAFVPPLSDQVGPGLGTTYVIRYVHERLAPPESAALQKLKSDRARVASRMNYSIRLVRNASDPLIVSLRSQLVGLDGEIQVMNDDDRGRMPIKFWRLLLGDRAAREPFVKVGHSMCALLAGLIGAAVARRFQARHARPTESSPGP